MSGEWAHRILKSTGLKLLPGNEAAPQFKTGFRSGCQMGQQAEENHKYLVTEAFASGVRQINRQARFQSHVNP